MDSAGPGSAAAAHRDHQRRQNLLCRLFARLLRTARSEDGHGEGLAVARRTEVAALWNYGPRRRDLVQRIGRKTEYAGPLRSQDRKIPDVDHPCWWRRSTQYDDDAGREPGDGGKR